MSIFNDMRTPQPAAVLELLKPITWFRPMWAFGCGVVSTAGATPLRRELVCGSRQTINDSYDRHVDAVSELRRPIPSAHIPGTWGIVIAIVWSVLSIGVAAIVEPFVTAATIVGVAFAWTCSAPPLRLKLNGWWGNSAPVQLGPARAMYVTGMLISAFALQSQIASGAP